MEEKEIYHRGEVKLGLERMRLVMEACGHPEQKVPMVQVAGTNGKGSCGLLMRGILTETGLRVGHYQTPALVDPMEIISVNGVPIAQETFQKLEQQLEAVCNEKGLAPTRFEKDTAIAFGYFAEMGCDVVILEAGLGGDEDATNVTEATILSVITSIGMDHMEFLGHTITEIAGHKAGIIKPGTPVVTGELPEVAMEVIRARAEALQAPLQVAAGAVTETVEKDGRRTFFWDGQRYTMRLPGAYQVRNAALALCGLEMLRNTWEPLRQLPAETWETAKERGLLCEPLFGRFFRVGEKPTLLLDGAHNVPAAKALREALQEQLGDTPVLYMTAVFGDKEFRQVAQIIAGDAKEILVAKAPGQRGVPAEELAAMLEETWDVTATPCESITAMVAKALERAAAMEQETGVWPWLVGFGSLSWLTIAREAYERLKNI